jgi:D-threo-aldose 1-dehydrogenase
VGVVIGGPYNSGILATGPRPGAHYNYAPAPQTILDRAARLQAICTAHGVRLIDAAFRFPLLHPATLSVIPGGQGLSEMEGNVRAAGAGVPAALWQALAAEGLIPAALVPQG